MARAFQMGPRKRRPVINITPLIDVMFLLLIFFMASATFRDAQGIDLDLPAAETGQPRHDEPHEIVVTRDGQWRFAGESVDEAGLRAGLEALLEADPEAAVVLRADAGAAFGRVVRAMDIARETGGTRLIVPTRPLEDQAPSP